jgi:hypothetical protein
MRLWIVGAVAAAASMLGAVTAMAGPGAMPGSVDSGARGASLIQPVHGCHRWAQDDLRGWHRHVGPNCRRVQSGPEEQNPYSRCRTKCNYVGPIKQCRRVCD